MAIVNDSTSDTAAELALLRNIFALILDASGCTRAVSGLKVVEAVRVSDSMGLWDRVGRGSGSSQGYRGEDSEDGG